MSNFNQISRVAFLVSAAVSLAACSDGGGDVSGGGGTPTAADFCQAVATDNVASTYSGTVSSLITGGTDVYQFSVIEEPSRGSVTMDPNTGDYTYTADDGRGYEASFRYAVEENGTQLDDAEVALIFGSKRIMPLGDSITYGVTNFSSLTDDQPTPPTAVGYRQALYDMLVAEEYEIEFVGPEQAGSDAGIADPDHAGFPGWTATELVSGNPDLEFSEDGKLSDWLAAHPTDLVLMHAGTNDLFQNQPETFAVSNVTAVVSALQASRPLENFPMAVLAAQIIPSNTGANNLNGDDLTPIINSFNTLLASNLTGNFVNSDGNNFQLHVVDQHSALDNLATDLTSRNVDTVGLHPTNVGYAKMADAWFAKLINTGVLEKCE